MPVVHLADARGMVPGGIAQDLTGRRVRRDAGAIGLQGDLPAQICEQHDGPFVLSLYLVGSGPDRVELIS
jgi:hypothetical protein